MKQVYGIFSFTLSLIFAVILLVSYPIGFLYGMKKFMIVALVSICLMMFSSKIQISTVTRIVSQLTQSILTMYDVSPVLTMSVIDTFFRTRNISKTLDFAKQHFDVSELSNLYSQHTDHLREFAALLFGRDILFLIQFNCIVILTHILEKIMTVFTKTNKKINVLLELAIMFAFTGFCIIQYESFQSVYVLLLILICICYSLYLVALLKGVDHPVMTLKPLNVITDFSNVFIILYHLIKK